MLITKANNGDTAEETEQSKTKKLCATKLSDPLPPASVSPTIRLGGDTHVCACIPVLYPPQNSEGCAMVRGDLLFSTNAKGRGKG